MSQANRVFITGRSALTASGATADETWNAIISGQCGIDEIKFWELSEWSHRLGGEIKDFQPSKMLPDRKLIKVISRQDIMGINAAVQAVEHSKMIAYRDSLAGADLFNEQTAIYVGSPGNKYFQQYDFIPLLAKTQGDMRSFANHLFDEVHPMWLLRILPNNVLAYTGITYGFKGPNHNVTNHAVGGTQAILEAYHAIRSGQAERAVVVAYDIGTEPQGLFYYEKLGVVSNRHLKPFDKEHDGTILAEGAAALVLESEASVKSRAATCYGEIVGGLSASEARGLFSIEADGQHLASLMGQTLSTSGINSEEIGLIVTHGNGNSKSDDSEALAIKSVFKQEEVPATAFKWSMGHTLCASGVLDAVLTTYALETKCVPGIANFQQIAPTCEGLSVSREHRELISNSYAMMINRGFASMNVCLVIKACE
ncbi:TPA: 3-oxoacyl-ACP synthase [Legionella pneumophila]|uniref:beta-ketoacyl-[acyl-carrier-protein] synthase family protein n=1 Tax=Legionella pneumophila TaxID=446 RepID=UPI000CEAC47A|nr:beta-ketoacyl synthase N-terminal-like domain-containing protein [Legionella pneumophila]PPK28472.1 3-oxoacyl-ACP synthase [Legionella pneumophila]HAU0264959.1 3-oxoacyl-ACP synthase [Legionella pneumophila]HAU0270572.1 3-oxoacyl-ACP synthase [Legionella pneumophila]